MMSFFNGIFTYAATASMTLTLLIHNVYDAKYKQPTVVFCRNISDAETRMKAVPTYIHTTLLIKLFSKLFMIMVRNGKFALIGIYCLCPTIKYRVVFPTIVKCRCRVL